MPQLDSVRIRSGEASFSPTLGGYYIDLTSVVPLVESGFHGPLDDDGVPLAAAGASDYYNLTLIAQYSLALHGQILKEGRSDGLVGKFATQLKAILDHIEREGDWRGFFIHRRDNPKYEDLRAPWVSALSQGNSISALLRGHQLLGDEDLLEAARQMFGALERPLEEGGVQVRDQCGHLWFEEYPLSPPIHVLNGFIFALWGVLDFARATGEERAWAWWRQGVDTLKAHLPDFDCGYWSVYDLRHRELASQHYQVNIHVPQLEAMHLLTSEPVFKKYAEQWRRFARSPWRRVVWWTALRFQARRRGYRFR